MASHGRNSAPPRDREARDAGLIESPQRTGECYYRDLGRASIDKTAEHQSRISRIISGIDQAHATVGYAVDSEDKGFRLPPNSSTSSVTSPAKRIISWEDGDPQNPYNWSSVRFANPLLRSKCLMYSKLEEESFCGFHWNARGHQQHYGLLASLKRNTSHQQLLPYRILLRSDFTDIDVSRRIYSRASAVRTFI
jgi:hypothetical protein